MIVEPKNLSPNELNLCLTKLRHANKLLKKWAKLYGFRKGREFRNLIFNGDNNPGGVIPKDKICTFHKDVQTILSIRNEKVVELDNETVEMTMLRGFVLLSTKHAYRWFNSNGGQELEDYESESILALLDAIYGFTDENITFTTYAWAVIRNRMTYSSNKLEKLSPLTTADRKLLISYQEAKSQFVQPASFDEIVDKLELNQSEISLLSKMLTRVVNESQYTDQKTVEKRMMSNDYTALRRNLRDNEVDQSLVLSVRSAVERANLTEFESAVLEASLNPYHGWKTSIAKDHINPKTGKEYSRMGTLVALKSAKSKVKNELEKSKLDAA